MGGEGEEGEREGERGPKVRGVVTWGTREEKPDVVYCMYYRYCIWWGRWRGDGLDISIYPILSSRSRTFTHLIQHILSVFTLKASSERERS
jgi:hypothetical protein